MSHPLDRRTVLAAAGVLGISAVLPGSSSFASNRAEPLLTFDVVSATSGDAPLLTILPDGTARTRAVPGRIAAKEVRLSEAEVQALMDFLVDDIGFMSINDSEIRSEIDRLTSDGSRIFSVADAGETQITLNLPDARHSVSVYATAMAAQSFPEIDALQRLRRAELRLLELVETIRTP